MSAFFESLTGLAFLDPWLLVLSAFVPVALVVRRSRRPPAARFAPGVFLGGPPPSSSDAENAAALPPLPASARSRLRGLPRVLQVAALLLVVAAVARPVHRARLPLTAKGIDLALCLDVSSSMKADDLQPGRTRLDIAKDAAAKFIAGRPHDRIALIAFARYPDLRCPFTLDHAALQAILRDVGLVDVNGPEDATGIGTAVALAVRTLRPGADRSKVVILLTDGEENVASAQTADEIAPLHAAQLCREFGIRVHAIAVGESNRDAAGRPVKLDTTQVRRLADRTGGSFFAAPDATSIASVYGTIDALEKVRFDEPRYRIEERYLSFLVVALVLLATGRLLEGAGFEALP